MLTETVYETSDTRRRVVLVKRLNNKSYPFYVKSTGYPLPIDFSNLADAYRYYNEKAAEVDQKWGSFKTSYNL